MAFDFDSGENASPEGDARGFFLEAGELPARPDEAGFEQWQEEQMRLTEAISRRFGVAIGNDVRVQLRDFDDFFEGKLRVVREKEKDQTFIRLTLSTLRFNFSLEEIVSCVVVSPESNP